jgi:hypothetical protein
MHDIKYFFSIKVTKQIRGDKKKFRREENKLLKVLSKNTIFQNSEAVVPLALFTSALYYICSLLYSIV